MGWLELLPLMRRLLPMLSQLTPMLESMLAGRMGGRAEAERTTAAVSEMTSAHTGLLGALEEQRTQLTAISVALRSLQAAEDAQESRAAAMERQFVVLTSAVRTAAVVLGTLLVICLVLLGVLVLRHR